MNRSRSWLGYTAAAAVLLGACSSAPIAADSPAVTAVEPAASTNAEPRTPQAWLERIVASRTPLTLVEEGRVPQCSRLIEVINEQQATIRDAKTDDAAAMRALAVSLHEIVELVAKVQVQSAPLVSFRKRYMLLLSDFARTAASTAHAMDAKDLDLLRQAQVHLRDVGPRETALVAPKWMSVAGDDSSSI